MKYYLTNHARERMFERNISIATVRAILREGSLYKQGDGSKHIKLYGYTVVIKNQKIITVYT